MSTLVVSVTGVVVQVVTEYADTHTLVINSGPNPVYISDSNSVTVGSGFPVAVGSVLSWPSGQALYAVSDLGTTVIALPTDATFSGS